MGMPDSKQWVLDNIDVLFAAVVVFLLLLLVLFIISSARMRKVRKQYRTLMKGLKTANLEEVLFQYTDDVRQLESTVRQVVATHEQQRREIDLSCGPVGVVRYNAFSEAGSDLSFSVALLNREADGVVITSIFGREESRAYAKPITAGHSTYNLSGEEKQAIQKAIDQMK
jgi:hypothetical protein